MIHPITSLGEFLAHAIAIEHEATERYREFEEIYGRRGEPAMAELCANLARLEGEHLEAMRSRSHGVSLPDIPSEQYRWLEGASPEAPARTILDAAGSRRDLLRIALRAESGAVLFFHWVARTATDPQVREMAREMAREEEQHVAWLERALGYASPSSVPA